MIVGDVSSEGNFDFVPGTATIELAARFVGIAFLDTVVDQGV